MKTLAFTVVTMLLFNLIMVHAVLRIGNELDMRVSSNAQQINALIEQHYKGEQYANN